MSNKSNIHISGKDFFVMLFRYILCLIFPPLAVIDKGCGSVLLVFVFTLCGWLPGTILAFLICIKDKNYFCKKQ